MLGILRFILAYFVFWTHFPESGFKLSLGITSVIIFYFISGFLMMKSYRRFKKYSPTPVASFYLDRCIKIFPQYLIVLVLTVIAFNIYGVSTHHTYQGVSFEPLKVIFDAFLIPVNFVIGATKNWIPVLGGKPIVPPAWSLSIEVQFYLLVPLLIVLSKRVLTILIIGSALLLTFSFFSDNPIWNTLNFGYRYIPSMLLVFVFGMVFASDDKFHKQLAFSIWAYFCVLSLFVLPVFPAWYHFAVQEIVIGIVIALPLFHYAINFKFEKDVLIKFDRWLGDLSYPIFLSHYLGIYLAQHFFGVNLNGKVYFIMASMIVFVSLSIGLAFLQRQIDAARVDFRGFESMRT